MTKKKQKVAMPAGIRNKLMAATSMLLVASIMMVSSTYAWFTLSTAPEVTGITTSVGANGNLEIALLTTNTYQSPESISSSTGDSSAHQAVTAANITWGNLVDLSDPSYGLNSIQLMPAAANMSGSSLNPASLLMVPVYGADGRVDTADGATVSSAERQENVFRYNSAQQTYGVRAIGVANNISPRQLAFNNAKSAISASKSSAANALKTAVAANTNTLLVVAMAGDKPDSYDAAQIAGLKNMVTGAQRSLEYIVKAYANSAIATATSGTAELSNESLTALSALSNSTNAGTLATALGAASVSAPSELTDLATMQSDVAGAIETLNTYSEGATSTEAVTAVNTAVGKLYESVTGDNGALGSQSASNIVLNGGSVYVSGGAIGAIANAVGKIELAKVMQATAYAGTKAQATTGTLDGIITEVTGLPAPAGAAVSAISDTYGYAIDFVFRTNAADSYLKLQTAAANRVYNGAGELTEGQGTATQGGGSTVDYKLADGVTEVQAKKLLDNIRIVFFDPSNGAVYADARLDTERGALNGGVYSAEVKLFGGSATPASYTAGKDLYEQDGESGYKLKSGETLVGETGKTVAEFAAQTNAANTIETAVYNTLDEASSYIPASEGGFVADSDAKIVALSQNTAQKVSVLVYLDGETIRNADVVNAASSGDLSLNLQFSSTADLVPMQNTALKNMTVTTQETTGGENTNVPGSGN